MADFLINSDRTELPRNTLVKTTCAFPYTTGALIVFQIGNRLSIGRWLPNIGGHNWILQPGRLICLLDCAIKIIGKVMATHTQHYFF